MYDQGFLTEDYLRESSEYSPTECDYCDACCETLPVLDLIGNARRKPRSNAEYWTGNVRSRRFALVRPKHREAQVRLGLEPLIARSS